MNKWLKDWKIHVLCIIFVILAELIAAKPFGPFPVFGANIGFTLLPMLYVLIFGIIMASFKLIPSDMMKTASPYIGIATMWLTAKMSTSIGPQINDLFRAGPALILQEFGNLGTLFLAVPLAVLVFKMGRQAIGAGFSNSREGSIAIMSSMYGLDSPQGQGVMGAYVTGTVLGTLFCGVMASVSLALGFHPYSLAMAAGTGSASMMTAALAPLQEAYPEMAEQLATYASTSNILSSVDGLYMSLFLAIPLTNWLFKVLKGDEIHKRHAEKKALLKAEKLRSTGVVVEDKPVVEIEAPPKPEPKSFGDRWIDRTKVLGFSAIFGLIANYISTAGGFKGLMNLMQTGEYLAPEKVVTFTEGLPGVLLMAVPVVLGCLIDDFIRAKTKIDLPSIVYISFIGIVMGLPFFPFQEIYVTESAKIGLLPICTPILAYAGISIGKDLESFKEQGVGIVCTALAAFIGTYLGSAVIAEVMLRLQGII